MVEGRFTTKIDMRNMETAGLYQIQSEVEVKAVEGYALGKGKEVQFCLCLVSACLKTSTYHVGTGWAQGRSLEVLHI